MIKLFTASDKIYSSNGDKVIQATKAKVHKADNGDYYLTVETGLEYVNDLVEGNILVAPTPQGEQAFRIFNPQKTRKKITVKAFHVFYDAKNYLIRDSYVVDKNCNDALDHLNNATDTLSPFTTLSDILTVDSFRCVRKSLYEAIQTVVERWGGHLVRDNWQIKVMSTIGADNGVTVRYAKNLKEITCAEKWDNVVTKLLPTGNDGIMLDSLDDTVDPYVYSTQTYDIPYTKTIAFSQNVDEELYKDNDGNLNEQAYKQALIDDLRYQAQNYVDKNSLPQINYTLKANLEHITDIGDVIEVIDERLGVNVLTNLIAFDYDCILGEYTELQFGNFTQKLSDLQQNITNSAVKEVEVGTKESLTALEAELEQSEAKIMGVMGNGYVIYNGNQILIVDTLPQEDAHNVIKINYKGIGFSQNGIGGDFTSAWTIDGTLNMQAINVINMTASMIKGGTLKLGSNFNESGILELYDAANNLIGQMTQDGLKMYGKDGSYILINNQVGFAGYDRENNKLYWVDKDEFHQKKSVVEEEITLCGKMRFIPITLKSGGAVVNDGIGLVSTGG